MSDRREKTARETLDAIRLAIEGAANDARAVAMVRMLLADAPGPDRKSTDSPRLMLRAWDRVRRAEQRYWRVRDERP